MFIIAAAGMAKALLAVTISLHPAAHQPSPATPLSRATAIRDRAQAYGNAADWPAVWWANRHQVPNPK